MQNTPSTANTHRHARTNLHTFSHSTEPFLKPGLIFIWIIGLCAYRLHHIGRLKPSYRPIERQKRFLTSRQSHSVTSRFRKGTQTFVEHVTKEHRLWAELHRSLKARTKVLAELARSWGRFRFIYSESCYNNCSFFSLFSPRGSKQILFWKCYWCREANTVPFLFTDLAV